uniref:F-box family protein n=1 Tax=Solanum tuberosum TaxID=4113 RepID=M1AYW9_SOLTU
MERSTIDILPECLIEKVVSYLSFEDAAKMSILSKTWLRSWFTHPNIEFKYPYRGNFELVDTIMNRYRDEKIPIDKFELSYSYYPQVSPPIDKWLYIALQNGVKYIFFKIPDSSLSILTILTAKSLTELVVECCTLMPILFSNGVTNCNSLRKLSLTRVKLDENMLQTLLNCCPLIVSFIFDYCWGFKKIELLNLQKIKSVSIKSREQNKLVKIQAPTLEHLTYDGYLSGKLDIVECQNLKSLDISHVRISDEFLQNLISALKDLKIQFCEGEEEIDSSNLESLEYMGYKIPKLKIARELKHLKINLQCFSSLKAAWFCNLRKLLSNSMSCPEISVDFSKCNEINLTDLQLHQGVATPKVDVLNVNCTWRKGECPTFLDALLLSCHPRRLNIRSTSATFKCFINRLIYMKNMSFDDNRSQSWHLVELQLNREGLSIRPDMPYYIEYSFLFDW